MNNEMFQAIIELVKQGGTAAVWLAVLHYVVILLKLFIMGSCVYLTAKIIISKIAEMVKHSWDVDVEIQRSKTERFKNWSLHDSWLKQEKESEKTT